MWQRKTEEKKKMHQPNGKSNVVHSISNFEYRFVHSINLKMKQQSTENRNTNENSKELWAL